LAGETQLRARRTRIKILRAIADKRGVARFSDIRNSTGLSTGSIYYHLERMADYVGKNSKEYTLTDKGFLFLHEIDHSYIDNRPKQISVSQKVMEDQILPREGISRQSLREIMWIIPYAGIVTAIISILQINLALGLPGLDLDNMIANASLISSLSITGILAAAFLIMFRRQLFPRGVKGIFLSTVTISSVVGVNLVVFSGLYSQIGVISSISYTTELIANASLISSLSITGILAAAFLIMFRRQLIPGGVKGLTFPAFIVVSVVIVNILVFSGLGAQVTMSQVVY
jgi:predicted transcriptional regulator